MPLRTQERPPQVLRGEEVSTSERLLFSLSRTCWGEGGEWGVRGRGRERNQKASPPYGPKAGETCFSGWSGVEKPTQMKTPGLAGQPTSTPRSWPRGGAVAPLHALPAGFPAVSTASQLYTRPALPYAQSRRPRPLYPFHLANPKYDLD